MSEHEEHPFDDRGEKHPHGNGYITVPCIPRARLDLADLNEKHARICARRLGSNWATIKRRWAPELPDPSRSMAAFVRGVKESLEKVKRGECVWPGDPEHCPKCMPAERQAFTDDLAQAVLNADQAAMRAGIDLAAAVRDKFNRDAIANGYPERL
jgi:hypothetical protein